MRRGVTHTLTGTRALLLDRLVDLDPHMPVEPQPLRVFNQAELRESVRREVTRLLNTRSPVPIKSQSDDEQTVLDYGVPDFSALSPHSTVDYRTLEQAIHQSLTAFEPRLRHVQVQVEQFVDTHKALLVRINAQLEVETLSEPVSFPVWIHRLNGEVDVHENKCAG